MSEQIKANTGATTAGWLPGSIGVLLLSIVTAAVLVFASEFGYSTRPMALIIASGAAAALGVRVAATGRTRNIVVGVSMLWLSALVFTGGTGVLIIQQSPSGLVATLVVAVVASAALLGPFGIVSNTARTYGHGAGTAVLRRYLIGAVLLSVLVSGLGGILLLRQFGAAVILAPLPGADRILSTLSAFPVRVTIATIVYAVTFSTLPWAVRSFPAEVFVQVTNLDRLAAFRQRVVTVSRYGRWMVVAYVAIALLTAGGFSIRGVVPRSEAELIEVVLSVAEPITRAGASQTVVVTVAVTTGVVLGILLLLGWLRDLGTASGAGVAEAVLPPVILFAGVLGGATIFADRIPLATVERALTGFAEPGSPVYEVVVESPGLVVGGLGTVAILISGFVLLIPVFIAGGVPGDESLTGIIASVIALVAMVVVAVFKGGSLGGILLGIGSTAVIWELGEYATVAVGELRSRGTSRTLPAGVTTLLSIHVLVTLCVVAVGAGVVVGLTSVAVGATLPLTAALPAVLATVVGLAALILLLTG